MGPLGIFCHFKQVFCRNGLPRLAVGLGSHYQVPRRAGIISWSVDGVGLDDVGLDSVGLDGVGFDGC